PGRRRWGPRSVREAFRRVPPPTLAPHRGTETARRALDFHGEGFVGLRYGAAPLSFGADGTTAELPFVVPAHLDGVAVASTGHAMISYGEDALWFGRRDEAPRILLQAIRPVDIEWSPDGKQFAALAWPMSRERDRIWLFDDQGEVVADHPIDPAPALAWIGPGQLVVGEVKNGEPVGVQCWQADDSSLKPGAFIPLQGIESPHYDMTGGADGTLVFEVEAPGEYDVGVLALSTQRGAALEPLGDGARKAPLWLDDQRLAFRSDGEGPPEIIIHDYATGRSTPHPLAGYAPTMCAVHGPGQLLCVVAESRSEMRIATLDADGGEWTMLPHRPPWLAFARGLDCTVDGYCLLSNATSGATNLYELSPRSGATEERLACPEDAQCRDAWSVSPDGKTIVTRTEDEEGIVLVDVASGKGTVVAVPDSHGFVLRSPTIDDGGRIIASQNLVGASTSDVLPFRIVAIQDGALTVLAERERDWLQAPRLSPDGQRIAYEQLSFHSEAATVNIADGCR
ncbi:MAG: hypothetical protein AAF721_11720, partial [Myxococcota bacterium]